MSAHEERRAQAFRKTDETEQSLIVGSTILLGSIPLFPGVSRPTARITHRRVSRIKAMSI